MVSITVASGLFSGKKGVSVPFLIQVLVGNLFLIACAKIMVPLQPVPFSMQTFALFILAFTLGSEKAFFAVCAYLIEATLGLPVLSTPVNPLWFFGPTGGYLIAFPLSVYLMGKIAFVKKEHASFRLLSSFVCGILLIYTLGVLFLSRLVGMKQAILAGIYPFILVDLLKLLCATCFCSIWMRRRGNDYGF